MKMKKKEYSETVDDLNAPLLKSKPK